MLQFEMLPASLAGLLRPFRSCFTAPSFRTFCVLLAGMVAMPARRTVCGMLTGAGLAGVWHHSRAHWFFGRARWRADQVGLVLLRLIVARLLDAHAPVVVAVDDTLFRRSGRKVHAAWWQHDGSRHGPGKDQVSFGNGWVIAGVIVTLPFMTRPVCLPVAATLWIKKGPTKQVIAAAMITAIAAALPERQVHLVADSWYAGVDGAAGAARGATRGRGLPPGVTVTSRLRVNAALHAIATPIPGAGGRPRRIGARIGSPKDLAAAATWRPAHVRRYGTLTTVTITERQCLWYGVYRSRTVRVILLRDPRTTGAYQLALITTDLHSTAEQIIERYAARWSIEVAIEDAKQITGVGEARNRTPAAVARTVPFGLLTQSIVTVWYTQAGHHPAIIAERRRHAPWYTTKTQPAYHDMITKLRRTLIAARYQPTDLEGTPRTPTHQETLAIHQAWADAAA